MKKIIGLQLAMQQHGHKYKDVAEKLGVSYQSVQAWCNGNKNIPEKRLVQLEELYKVDREILANHAEEDTFKAVLKGEKEVIATEGRYALTGLVAKTNIVLQPTSDPIAKRNFNRTLKTAIKLDEIKRFLISEQINKLEELFPTGDCYIWGVKTGKGEATLKQYKKLQKDDLVIFYQDKTFYAQAQVAFLCNNVELSEFLWDDGMFENIYFVYPLKPFYLEVQKFNLIVYDKEESFPVMGFKVLNELQSEKLINALDITPIIKSNNDVDISKDKLLQKLIDLESNKELERVTKQKQRVEQQLLRDILFYNKDYEKCSCCGEEYPVESLTTAHIKKRSQCTKEEKLDINIVFPMCKFGCDELFEVGLLVVNNEGRFQRTDELNGIIIRGKINDFLNLYDQKVCDYWNENTEDYFAWHFANNVKSY